MHTFYYGYTKKHSFSGKDIFSFYTPDYTHSISKTINKKDLIKIISTCYHEYGNTKCFEMIGTMQKNVK